MSDKPYYAYSDTRQHLRYWVFGQMMAGAGKAALVVVSIGVGDAGKCPLPVGLRLLDRDEEFSGSGIVGDLVVNDANGSLTLATNKATFIGVLDVAQLFEQLSERRYVEAVPPIAATTAA